jgi:hypothetical protein
MDKTDFDAKAKFLATLPQEENVLPRTLVIKPLVYKQPAPANDLMFSGVYGGQDGDIWTATFYDNNEAQAFIIGSNHFGRPVKGVKVTLSPDEKPAEYVAPKNADGETIH